MPEHEWCIDPKAQSAASPCGQEQRARLSVWTVVNPLDALLGKARLRGSAHQLYSNRCRVRNHQRTPIDDPSNRRRTERLDLAVKLLSRACSTWVWAAPAVPRSIIGGVHHDDICRARVCRDLSNIEHTQLDSGAEVVLLDRRPRAPSERRIALDQKNP